MSVAVATPPPGRLRLPAARITTSADGTYKREPSGRPAIIWPVRNNKHEPIGNVAGRAVARMHVETSA